MTLTVIDRLKKQLLCQTGNTEKLRQLGELDEAHHLNSIGLSALEAIFSINARPLRRSVASVVAEKCKIARDGPEICLEDFLKRFERVLE